MKLKPVTRVTKIAAASQKSWTTSFRETLIKRAKLLFIILGAFLVVAMVFGGKAIYTKIVEDKATSLYLKARSPQDFQVILDKYPSTSSAPLAAYSLGTFYQSRKNWDEAQKGCKRFFKS